jgi:predicted nucleic acid-binding protein
VIIADTSGLLAFFNTSEPTHAAVVAIVENEREPLVVSPFVVAELDYIVATRIGVAAELAVLAELATGAYEIPSFDARDIGDSRTIIDRYRDQTIGVTDASLVVLANRYQTRTILTLDHRHFDVVRPSGGGRFKVVP